MSARGYALHSVCPQLYIVLLLPPAVQLTKANDEMYFVLQLGELVYQYAFHLHQAIADIAGASWALEVRSRSFINVTR